MDGLTLRQLIGRLASHAGPPRDTWQHWDEQRDEKGGELFVLPVLPGDSLNESVEIIRDRGYCRGFLATVWWRQGSERPCLAWLAVELTRTQGHGDSHLPTTLSTTVDDLLRILQPGASMTVRLEPDELVLRPSASFHPIVDDQAVESLQHLAPA